ncbi:MAG: methyltransferase [Oligoflexia bacterium]|nr:methyltransferase [Oligoflexia bacterium]
MDYLQPEFYKFNEDSIALAKFANQKINLSIGDVLDLGCGCGVIGIEFLRMNKNLTLTLLEKNYKFKEYIDHNLNLFHINAQLIISDWEEHQDHYDIILSNPPYFFEESSRPSTSMDRDQCRRWSKEQSVAFFYQLKKLLKPNGTCFLSLRSSKDELQEILEVNNLVLIDSVEERGCSLFEIKNR